MCVYGGKDEETGIRAKYATFRPILDKWRGRLKRSNAAPDRYHRPVRARRQLHHNRDDETFESWPFGVNQAGLVVIERTANPRG